MVVSDGIGGWHCTACHLTIPDLSALSGRCDRSANGEHVLYVQLGQGYPNGWDGAPCTCGLLVGPS